MDYCRNLEITLAEAQVKQVSTMRTRAAFGDTKYYKLSVDVVLAETSSGGGIRTPVAHASNSQVLEQDSPRTFYLDDKALQANRLVLAFKLVRKRASQADQVYEVDVPVEELLRSSGVHHHQANNSVIYQINTRDALSYSTGTLKFSYRLISELRPQPNIPERVELVEVPVVGYPYLQDGRPNSSTDLPTPSAPPQPPHDGGGQYQSWAAARYEQPDSYEIQTRTAVVQKSSSFATGFGAGLLVSATIGLMVIVLFFR